MSKFLTSLAIACFNLRYVLSSEVEFTIRHGDVSEKFVMEADDRAKEGYDWFGSAAERGDLDHCELIKSHEEVFCALDPGSIPAPVVSFDLPEDATAGLIVVNGAVSALAFNVRNRPEGFVPIGKVVRGQEILDALGSVDEESFVRERLFTEGRQYVKPMSSMEIVSIDLIDPNRSAPARRLRNPAQAPVYPLRQPSFTEHHTHEKTTVVPKQADQEGFALPAPSVSLFGPNPVGPTSKIWNEKEPLPWEYLVVLIVLLSVVMSGVYWKEALEMVNELMQQQHLQSSSDPIAAGKGVSSKLAVLQERFTGIERQMEQEVRHRRDSEETRLGSIREGVGKLERTLNSEIKHRVEANKAMKGMFEMQITAAQERMETFFTDRLDQLQGTVDAISERVAAVERDFATERERYIRDIEEKNASVARDVSALHNAMESDRISRQERETNVAKRLADLEYRTEGRLEQERVSRETKLSELRETVTECKRLREKGDEKFQSFILEEVAAIKNNLVLEAQQREQCDDDIVQALNHYTRALQDALRIVNSTSGP
ncbi:hypothetical protein FOL47_006830 [Perkinsus chesapeaki]|uniref:Uncharacterized protein n=1 Tax=Perkinsus chesapeaki TaxID=330153 RepID=A0A7J6MWM7_PERCH|nr:hypothetical protein FOL47_006830 [Perkinsus chesapeaki]